MSHTNEWQSVNIGRLTVQEARERLAVVEGRLHEGISYHAKTEDAQHAQELRTKILSEADAGQLRYEWHAARDRISASNDPAAKAAEQSWEVDIARTFLERANTADLAVELADMAPGDAWRPTVEREWHNHHLVDQIADTALEELDRWDFLAASQADGERLRELAAVAEKMGGDRGLEQFLNRLAAVDHKFHPNQLAHFSAAIGAEAAAAMAQKMDGRHVDVRPTATIPSFFESLSRAEVLDNLGIVGMVLASRLLADAKALRDALADPASTAESALQAIRDLPSDVVDTLRTLPDLPDRLAALPDQLAAMAKQFEQLDESEQVKALANALYDVEKGLVIDRGVDKAAGVVVEALVVGRGLEVGSAIDEIASVGKAGERLDGPDLPHGGSGPTGGQPLGGLGQTPDGPAASSTAPAVAEPPAAIHPPKVTGTADGRTAGTGGIERVDVEIIDNRNKTTIEGTIKEPIANRKQDAPNFNESKYYPSASAVGLPGYHKAHLFGPGFGDEAYDGITYAPADFNLKWQNSGIEQEIRDLVEAAKPSGATIHLKTEVVTHPRDVAGGNALATVDYEVTVILPNGDQKGLLRVHLEVDPPPSGRVHDVKVEEGPAWSNPSWLDNHPNSGSGSGAPDAPPPGSGGGTKPTADQPEQTPDGPSASSPAPAGTGTAEGVPGKSPTRDPTSTAPQGVAAVAAAGQQDGRIPTDANPVQPVGQSSEGTPPAGAGAATDVASDSDVPRVPAGSGDGASDPSLTALPGQQVTPTPPSDGAGGDDAAGAGAGISTHGDAGGVSTDLDAAVVDTDGQQHGGAATMPGAPHGVGLPDDPFDPGLPDADVIDAGMALDPAELGLPDADIDPGMALDPAELGLPDADGGMADGGGGVGLPEADQDQVQPVHQYQAQPVDHHQVQPVDQHQLERIHQQEMEQNIKQQQMEQIHQQEMEQIHQQEMERIHQQQMEQHNQHQVEQPGGY
jgi:hypothetical protein